MSRLIFKVNDVATIEGRGILVIGDWQYANAKADGTIAQKDDVIELRTPGGNVLKSRIEAFDYPRRDILLPLGTSKADIEPGTEIYSSDEQ